MPDSSDSSFSEESEISELTEASSVSSNISELSEPSEVSASEESVPSEESIPSEESVPSEESTPSEATASEESEPSEPSFESQSSDYRPEPKKKKCKKKCPCMDDVCSSDTMIEIPATQPCPDDYEEVTDDPVSYDHGEIQLSVNDLSSGGFGQSWGHVRTYSNQMSESFDYGNGNDWMVNQWSYLLDQGATVIVVRPGGSPLWFDDVGGGTYVGRYGILEKLTTGSGTFILGLTNGGTETYHDFAAGDQAGLLQKQTTPGGAFVTLSYDVDRCAQMERSYTLDGVTVTEQYLYDYGTGDDDVHIVSATLRRQVSTGGLWFNVRRARYAYYQVNEVSGSLGDLKTVTHQVPVDGGQWSDEATYYYRYYEDAAGGLGFVHGLKYVVNPAAFDRLKAAHGDPFTATDSQVAQFADNYFEYDDQQRVTKEVTAGGTKTTTLAYAVNADGSYSDGPNHWKYETTETRADGSRAIVYCNHLGQMMLKDFSNAEESQRWITYREFNANYSLILEAEPSAVNMSASPIYDPSELDLDVQLRTNAGLIRLTDYYTGSGGTPAGYPHRKSIRQGTSTTAIKLEEVTYAAETVSGQTVYRPTTVTHWRDEAGTQAIVTAYTYYYHPGTLQVLQRTTTLPVIPTAQNGSNASDVRREQFNLFGKRIWEQGPMGYVDHFTYDVVTGALVQHIEDVDSAYLAYPSTPTTPTPTPWTRPSGLLSPLNLITDFETDAEGRTTQTLGPAHDVDGVGVRTATWTVYLDAEHRTLSGRGFITGLADNPVATLVNPVSIRATDAEGATLNQISAARASTNGRLAAGNSFPQSTWTAWTSNHLDHAGRVDRSRTYHTIPCCGEGLAGTNYDETRYGYDVMGRRNRTATPGGTINRRVFDVLDRETATWVGTNDWGATDGDPAGGTYPHTAPPFNPESLDDLEFWGSGSYGLFQDSSGTTLAGPTNPVGCWQDRRNGSALKFIQTGTNNRPTVNGAPIFDRPTVRFDQSTSNKQYLLLSDSLFSAKYDTSLTLFLAYRTTTVASGGQRTLLKQGVGGDYLPAHVRDGNGSGRLATFAGKSAVAEQQANDTGNTGANQICIVACVFDAGTMRFYRDGALVSTQVINSTTVQGATLNTKGWSIGGEMRNGAIQLPTDAEVAEFLIYSQALGEDQLSQLFAWVENLPNPVPIPPQNGNNMVPVTSRTYSEDCGCAEPHVVTAHVDNDPANDRVTEYSYDFRNRMTIIDGEIDYYEERFYDNLDHVVKVERRNTNAAGNLIARSETFFDDQGRVYQTKTYGVDPATGTVGNALTAETWYDAAGKPIKQVAAGAKEGRAFTKQFFDSMGRVYASYVGYYTGTLPESYADVGQITSSNKIFEQTLRTYDNAGNLLQGALYQRFHDATGNGALNLPTGSQPKARVSYQASWYDGIGRTTATANYGTNGDAPLDRPATAPERSDTVLVMSYGYDRAGNQNLTIDPAGRMSRQTFNAVGKTLTAISNYVATSISEAEVCCAPCGSQEPEPDLPCPGDSENVTVRMAYNADGNLVRLTACNPTTGDQVTRYEYGVKLADSALASNLLVRATVYPDAADGEDRVVQSYNRQNQVVGLADQNGTVHAYAYDLLGRKTDDRVVTLGTNIDGAVRRLATAYEVRGLAYQTTAYNASSGGSVVNQVQFAYNNFEQLTTEYQAHSGAVNVSTTPKVQYTYVDGTGNSVRLTTITYPDGRAVTYDHGSGTDDDYLSRIAAIKESSTSRAEYTYYGLSQFCITNYVEPAAAFNLTHGGGGTDPYGGCLDRFGRMIQAPWIKSSSPIAGATYQYDRSSNRTQMQPLGYTATNDLQRYSYDDVNRLTRSIRGPANGLKAEETWSLDAAGNWKQYDVLNVDDADQNLGQQRSANRANEITTIARDYGANWATPVYDRAGNMTSFPRPLDPTSAAAGTYDAWNRLVATNTGSSVTYAYDVHNRRTTLTAGGTTRHFYYSTQWQILEERVGSATTADRQFLWGLRYIDDQVFRESSSTRLYGLQDANWNLVAVTDASGAIQQRYRYSAYGQPVRLNADGSIATGSDSILWDFLYCGYRYDRTTGLYQVRWRHLHPQVGVWLVHDPLGYQAGALNLSEYVGGKPTTFVDTFGLFFPFIGAQPIWARPTFGIGRTSGVSRPSLRIYQPPPTPVQPTPPSPPIMMPKGAKRGKPDVGGGQSPLPNPSTEPEWDPAAQDLPPPGKCCQADYDVLRQRVGDACKHGHVEACGYWGWNCDDYEEYEKRWNACAKARKEIAVKCFGGGNKNHRDEVDEARRQAHECYKLWMYHCYELPMFGPEII